MLLILLVNTSCSMPVESETFINSPLVIDNIEEKDNDYVEKNIIMPVWDNETTITIDRIRVNAKLKKADVEDAIGDFSDLEKYPLWISSTPLFGNSGLSAIIGHRQWGDTPKVFADLDKLQTGNTIIINNLKYSVQYTIIIKPEKIYTTYNNLNEQFYKENINGLMLITCTPYGTSLKRLLIIAKQEAK